MKKLAVKDLIEFRRRSERGKKSFIESFKSVKINEATEGGGNYWISGLSAVCNAFKEDNLDLIDEKIEEIQDKIINSGNKITQNMYQANIDILNQYKTLPLKNYRPKGKITFLRKGKLNPILNLKGLEIEARPSHVYKYTEKEEEKMGAIWFVAKKGCYSEEELALVCGTEYRFLTHYFAKTYIIEQKYCFAVDLISGQAINQTGVIRNLYTKVLTATLDEINKRL